MSLVDVGVVDDASDAHGMNIRKTSKETGFFEKTRFLTRANENFIYIGVVHDIAHDTRAG